MHFLLRHADESIRSLFERSPLDHRADIVWGADSKSALAINWRAAQDPGIERARKTSGNAF